MVVLNITCGQNAVESAWETFHSCNHHTGHDTVVCIAQLLVHCYVASVSAQVKDKSSAVLLSEITRLVLPGTRIITDALKS